MYNPIVFIREECDRRGIAVSTFEKRCGFSNGYLNPKKITKLPHDRAVIAAQELGISLGRLLTGEDEEKETDSITHSVKERIRALCAENNTSLPKLEAALGFGNSTISKWDKASPSLAKLEAVANYFGVSVSFLLGEEKKPAPVGDELDAELIEKLTKLKPEEAAMVRAYIDGMIANRK